MPTVCQNLHTMAPTRPHYEELTRHAHPVKPRNTRRAAWHDYQNPAIYMITLVKEEHIPQLSTISGSEGTVNLVETPTGTMVKEVLIGWNLLRPDIKVYDTVVMPDHIHFILHVTNQLAEPFSKMISALKAECTRRFRQSSPLADTVTSAKPFFRKNYHDRILRGKGQYANMARYIADNPRRYLMKELHPDLFRRINRLSVGSEEYATYGNLFLLREPAKETVIIRSHFSPEEVAASHRKLVAFAQAGGVVVSPFISPKERAILNDILQGGGKAIVILDNGFPERFKPPGKMFDHCLNGHLLYVAPCHHSTRRVILTRAKCWEMNRLAEKIRDLTPDDICRLKIPPPPH